MRQSDIHINKSRFLHQVTLFRGLPKKDVDMVARISRVREVRKGETVFSKSAPGDSLYLVVKGRVKIYGSSNTDKTKTFAYLEPHDFFGEMALMDEPTRSAGAEAAATSILLTIARKDFRALVAKRPSLAFAVIRTLCARLRHADRDIELLSFNTVVGRLARILLDMCDQYGKKTPAGIRIGIEVSHQELADMAGTAREMATRILNRFRRTGCLEMDGKCMIVVNHKKLSDWVC
ncbi:MAG TPA: Crp/Fnr family transcriptional regulator [Elusimicrobiota bacterium]|nr:Crp/Fnr family transcriptional regulator [Elusimicrobiota bacterium]